jgi:hypothetical protein
MPTIQTQSEVAAQNSDPPLPSIDGRRRWLALDLAELCTYHEHFYFFVYRDVNGRYEQNACPR